MRLLIPRASLLVLALIIASELAPAQMTYQTQESAMTPKKRELYFYGMRAYPFGKIPQGARQQAIYQTDTKMARFGAGSQSPLSVNTWKAIGPFDVGGRVRTVVCHPTDGKTLWIGAADGGVWRSTDRGESWTPIMDNENAIAMGALAVDPGNPNVLYAGTGEMSSNIDAYTGAGVLKSVDGGNSWRSIGLTNVGAFSRIVVHPKNSNLVFAGATKNNGGFYRSVDGGNTWSRTITEPVSDVTVNPNNANEVWAATMSKGVFRSSDGGVTFVESSVDLGQIGASLVRVSLQCAPSSPSTLYALTYETVGSGDGATHYSRIYKSTNSGAGWRMIFNNTPNFLNSTGSAQGWYNNVIAVKPDDPNTVVAGGIDIVRTTDGGNNWYYINTYSGNGPHPDQHAFAFDPTQTDRLYLGNDGGVYRSDDKGTTYDHKSQGLAITQFYGMGVDQRNASRTYGGTQDNGTVRTGTSGDGLVLGGDGFFVVVDHSNSNIIYAENPNGIMYRINLASGDRRRIVEGIPDSDEGAWSSPIAIDPENPNLLWHGRKTIYQTQDQGASWIPTNATFKGLASAIGISPVRPNVVYAGSDRGELFITTDQGFSWEDRTNAPGMPHRAITDLIGSATDAQTFYLSVSGFYSGHVFKTTDGGASWTNISGQLPDIPVNALAIHPEDEKIIYAGTDIGMFITTDGGATWYAYNEGLPRVAVADLEVHRSQKVLRMASHGRSMWEIALEKPEPAPSILSPIGGEVWMGGTQHAITWSGINGPVNIEFSLDDGEHWGVLATNVTAYSWNIFDTMAVAARIRITSASDPELVLTSRSFTIAKFAVGGLIRAAQVTTIPYGLVYDGEFVWATDFGGSKLLKLDANTLSTIEEVQLDPAMGDSLFTDLAYNPKTGHFFVHKLNNTTETSPGGMLFEIDRNGNEIRRWTSPCAYPIGLVFFDNGADGQLIATDRNGSQNIFVLDAANPSVRIKTVQRSKKVLYGPRGATVGPDGKSIYQVITDFTGEVLQTAIADKMTIDNQQSTCTIALTSPLTAGYINARGIEFDPRDSNLWVSDYSGSIFKIISCDSRVSTGPPPVLGAPGAGLIAGVSLEQNMPNPFSSSTSIAFTLPAGATVSLDLFDEHGRSIAQLAQGRYEAGSHRVSFDPAGIPSGVYRYTLKVNGHTAAMRTMVYVK